MAMQSPLASGEEPPPRPAHAKRTLPRPFGRPCCAVRDPSRSRSPPAEEPPRCIPLPVELAGQCLGPQLREKRNSSLGPSGLSRSTRPASEVVVRVFGVGDDDRMHLLTVPEAEDGSVVIQSPQLIGDPARRSPPCARQRLVVDADAGARHHWIHGVSKPGAPRHA